MLVSVLAPLVGEMASVTVRMAHRPHMERIVIRIGNSLNTLDTFRRYWEQTVITTMVLQSVNLTLFR